MSLSLSDLIADHRGAYLDPLGELDRILRVMALELSIRYEAGAFRVELRDRGLLWRHGDGETLEGALRAAIRAVGTRKEHAR